MIVGLVMGLTIGEDRDADWRPHAQENERDGRHEREATTRWGAAVGHVGPTPRPHSETVLGGEGG